MTHDTKPVRPDRRRGDRPTPHSRRKDEGTGNLQQRIEFWLLAAIGVLLLVLGLLAWLR